MKIARLFVIITLLSLSTFCKAKEISKKENQKRTMILLCVDGYNDPWRHAYKTPYPAKTIFKAFKKAGITDVAWQLERLRGKEVFYPTKLKSFKYNPQLAGRDWLEESLTEADKHGIKVWLLINPAYKNQLTKLKGLKAQTQNYVDLVNEIGQKYSKKHKSLAGVFHHETHAGESPDRHLGEVKNFSNFCQQRFGEKYTLKTMPDGQGKNKWNNRFFVYKSHCLNKFVKAINDTAQKYGMKSMYFYYPIENRSNSIAGGVDIAAIEDYSNGLWAIGQLSFYNFPNTFHDIALSYRGVNVSQNMVKAFHGRPVSIFEAQFQMFPKVTRESKRVRKNWTKRFGDLYDFYMRSEKVVDLFQGTENTKKWLDLIRYWYGGKDQSQVALVLSSYSFTMRHRPIAGIKWKKVFNNPLAELKKYFPVATVVVDNNFFEDYENLKKYKMLVIPEAMGICITPKAVASIKKYLASGGQVLAVRTRISSSRKDLTQENDYTREIFGIRIKKTKTVAGYHRLMSNTLKVSKKKVWGRLSMIDPGKTKVIVKDAFSGKPVLTRKNNAWFLALTLNNVELLEKVITKIAKPVVKLKDNTGFSIPAVVKKNNMLCVPLACSKTASAILSVNVQKAGLTGVDYEVKNIVTGKVLTTVNSSQLLKGIKVKTDFNSEPLILAVGPKSETKQFKGIFPDNKVFKDMISEKAVLENPEVAISVPDKPGIKVGIYQNSWGGLGIYNALIKNKDFNVFFLPRLDSECMANAQVIIIPQVRNYLFFKQGAGMIRDMVEKGGRGLLLTHSSAVRSKIVFPKLDIEPLGQYLRIKNNYLKLIGKHPANGELKAGSKFVPGFAFDHFAFRVAGFTTLAVDKAKRPAISVGTIGKGKVALYGSLPGWFGTWEEAKGKQEGELKGIELKQLISTIKWLAKKR